MKGDPHENEAPRPRRTPRRIVRWLGRLALWTILFAVAGALLATIAGVLAYSYRERLVNEALARFVEPFEVSVGAIDLSTPRRAVVEDLRLTPRGLSLDAPFLSVPSVEIRYGFHELRQDRLMRAVTLYAPVFTLDEEILAALARGVDRDDPEQVEGRAGPDLAAFHSFSESFTVHDGTLRLDLPGFPGVVTRWDLSAPPLLFDAPAEGSDPPPPDDASPLSAPFSLLLRDLQMDADDGGRIRLGRLGARFRLSPDFGRVEVERIDLERGDVVVTPDWFFAGGDSEGSEGSDREAASPAEPGVSAEEAPGAEDPAPGTSPRIRIAEFRLGRSSFALADFEGDGRGPRLPDLSFDAGLRLDGVSLEGGRWDSESPVEIDFEDVAVGPPVREQLGGAERLRMRAESLAAVVHERRFGHLRIEGLDLMLSDATLSRCRPSDERTDQTHDDDAAAEEAPPSAPWIVESLEVEDGAVLMRDLSFDGVAAPRVETRLSGRLDDLRFGGGVGFDSAGRHELRLARTRIHAPGSALSEDALFAFERGLLEGAWRPFAEGRRIDRLHVDGLAVRFADEALGDWATLGSSGSAASAPGGGDTSPAPQPATVYRVADLRLDDGVLVADSSFADGRVPKIRSKFRVETASGDPGDDPLYRFTFEDFNISNHAVSLEDLSTAAEPSDGPDPGLFAVGQGGALRQPVAEEEVISIETIEMLATASQLQAERRVRSVRIDGAALTVGQGLRAIAETGIDDGEATEAGDAPASAEGEAAADAPGPPQAAADGERAPPFWILEQVDISRSRVRFEALIPQIEGLEFTIETTLDEVPLSPDAILSQEAMQKVELSGIEIRDPYDSFITVAELPTIFVEFSLAGLARQEVERIDLISPALHVGQGLFWWIDYQRNFRAQNEGASVGIGEDAPVLQAPDWVIKTISASAGSIVVAPTGMPLGVVPFPFNATTNMEDGRIELLLNIPGEDHVYQFPEYRVELHGLEGNVEFNVPIQQLSNNLVQTFTLDRLIWRDYEARDLYLTVTFDAHGIYGALGGEAYDGYAEGQFNFYLDDPGKWDAWIAGTDLDTGPITQVLAPDNFLMEGKISLKLVSEGRRAELGETAGEFLATTPGWFDVTKLGGILDELPEEWTSLQRSFTELSLIALKRFDYDRGAGSLYLLGQDGRLNLDFTGPYGSRGLNLRLHDQRNANTISSSPPTSDPAREGAGPAPGPAEAAAHDAPRPEASARPVARR